jgi:aminoglycoside phosphotransferase (APT) family kinase protein
MRAIQSVAARGECEVRLSTDRCLEMMRLGIRDVLMQEVKSDDGRNAGRIILRTIDELLMRERAAESEMSTGIDRALEKCGDLLRRAEAAGLALAEHKARYETLLLLAAAWREAPDFVAVYRGILALAEEYVKLILDDEKGAPPALAMQAARLATELENEIDQAISSAATVVETAAEKEQMLTCEELCELLQRGLGEPEVKIERFERIPGGLSKRTYRFTAAAPRWGEHPLIARETAGIPHGDFDCWVLASEFQLVRDLSAIKLPVPEPLFLSEDGRFYVMHRSRGSGNTGMFAANRVIPKRALIDMAEFLGRLHSTPPDRFMGFIGASGNEVVLGETNEQCVRRMLLRWRDYSKRMRRLPSPIELGLFTWLWQNIPPNSAKPSLLHGDFGPHNCLWEGERLTAVLDWEGGHFGDPAFDLGYARPQIVSQMEWAEFLEHYERAGGPHITPARLEYFERFSMYRTLLTDNQCVARGQCGEKSDLFVLTVDYEYWPNFIRQTAASPLPG